MTYEEAIEYIHSTCWKGSRPGLSRIRELLIMMDCPQRYFNVIHVAGTNGKGSFCAMMQKILLANGNSVGMFTSPYVEDFEERFQIDGEMIGREELAEITEYVKQFADRMEDSPTEFELITAIGIEYFRRRQVDIAIVECGMGGRLDSTNVFPEPLLSVITGISLDHTEYLGNTISKIAAEKAGIIKKGCPVLFGGSSETAAQVIREKAKEMNAPFYRTRHNLIRRLRYDENGTTFDFHNIEDLHISMLGAYQPLNAANVIEAVQVLRLHGCSISDKALREGLAKASWKARFERLSDDPLVFYDGGHNIEGVQAAVETVKAYFPGRKIHVMSGVMADKKYGDMAKKIAEIADRVYTVTPDNPRALAAEKYAALYRSLGLPAEAYDSFDSAVDAAIKDCRENGAPLLCLGSLYSYCTFKPALKKALASLS